MLDTGEIQKQEIEIWGFGNFRMTPYCIFKVQALTSIWEPSLYSCLKKSFLSIVLNSMNRIEIIPTPNFLYTWHTLFFYTQVVLGPQQTMHFTESWCHQESWQQIKTVFGHCWHFLLKLLFWLDIIGFHQDGNSYANSDCAVMGRIGHSYQKNCNSYHFLSPNQCKLLTVAIFSFWVEYSYYVFYRWSVLVPM
jgi:hypothetical protein